LEHSHRSAVQVFLWYLFRPIREISIVNRDGFFRLLSTLAFFNGMVTSGDKVLLLYYVESRLNFSLSDTAIMLLLYGFGTTFAQGIVLKPLNDMLGERLILIISFVTALVCNTCYGLAKTKGALFGGISLASLAAMAFPTFSAIKANNVNESEQGRVQGALYAILALASGIGPMAMRYVDSIASGTFLGPGAMFLFAACLQLIAAFFTCWLPKERTDSRCRTNQPIPVEDDPFDGNDGDELVEIS
jgi:DHA1 family tetracycline resistance protein-like MFS transporter